MNLLPFYNYIRGQFVRRCKNVETSEDLTQDFFLYFLTNKNKLGARISMKFLHITIERFYGHYRQANRAIKRSGQMIAINDLLIEKGMWFESNVEERIYSQELFKIVERLANVRLRNAIYYYIDKISLSKDEGKYLEMIKSHRGSLMEMVYVS